MDELSPEAKALIARAAPEFEPSPAELERLHARLQGTPSGGTGEPSPQPRAARLRLLIGGGAVVLILAALGSAKVALDRRAALASPSEAVTKAEVDASTEQSPGRPIVGSPEPEPVVAEQESIERGEVVEDAPSPPARALGPSGRSKASVGASAGPAEVDAANSEAGERDGEAPAQRGLADELRLIADSRLALNGERFGEALSLARRYRSRYPAGSFLDEALALELLARCGLGSDAGLEDEVQAYLDSGTSQFAARVRAACSERP